MKRFILFILLIPSLVFAAPPSRTYTYTSGDIIDPTKVTTNEDNIFNYLTRGVDKYSASSITTNDILDGTITNSDLSGTAGITYGKLAGSIPDSKLDTISTAGKVNGAALTGLASIPAGAGSVPIANIPSSTILGLVYPVGSIYVSTVSTNPGTLLGFGTWTAFGAGRVLVGKAAAGTFNTAGATGGEETHVLTTTEMPAHTHGVAVTSTLGGGGGSSQPGAGNDATSTSAGSGNAHNNLQPYVVVYMWERTG